MGTRRWWRRRRRRERRRPPLRAAQLLPQGNGFHLPAEQEHADISVPADALTLNGGSIRAVDDNSDASLSHDGLTDDSTRKVDGTRGDDQAPTVRGFDLEQPVRGTFGGGDAIAPRVTFSEGVTMTGAPRLALRIGAETRFATFRPFPWAGFSRSCSRCSAAGGGAWPGNRRCRR